MKFDANELETGEIGQFIKFKDKEGAVGVFRGDLHHFYQHWLKNGPQPKSEPCLGQGCPLCAAGERKTFRFRVNFLVKVGDAITPMIFEQGRKVYKTLHDLHTGEWGPLDKLFVRITRNGAGNDTVYNIQPIPNGKIGDDKEKMLLQVKLHDLKNINTEAPAGQQPKQNEEDIPF